jgi:exosortase
MQKAPVAFSPFHSLFRRAVASWMDTRALKSSTVSTSTVNSIAGPGPNRVTPGAKAVTRKRILAAAWILLSLLLFARPVRDLVHLSLTNEDMSYVVVVPLLAAGVLWVERRRITETTSYNKAAGVFLLALSGFVALLAYFSRGAAIADPRLSAYILSLMLFWVAGFALLYGRSALRAAQFPFVFLLLTVPLPAFLVERFVYALQAGSAWITGALFELLRVPFLQEGFVFHLASVSIEVAKECSGIRSSMALLVLAVLIAHFQLKSWPSNVIFVVCGLLMMIVKNGIRVATLTLLSIYVDPGFLFGRLHQQGGVVFFLLGLLLLWPILLLLKRGESWWGTRQTAQISPDSTV